VLWHDEKSQRQRYSAPKLGLPLKKFAIYPLVI